MKKYDPKIHNRRSIRFKGYDYSENGFYFITICAKNWECLFGKIIDNGKGEMICNLNKYGKIVYDELQKTPQIRKNIKIDCCIVMPNHVHAIIEIQNNSVGAYCYTPIQKSNPVGAYCYTPTQNMPKQKNNPVGAYCHTPTQNTPTQNNNPVGAYCHTPIQNTPTQNMPKQKNNNILLSPSKNLGAMIRGYKSTVTKQINELRNLPKVSVWHRNYYEHIIRDKKSLEKIRDYIIYNPQKWNNDKFYKKL